MRIPLRVLLLLSLAACGGGHTARLSDQHRAALADSVRQMAAGLASRLSARGYSAFPGVMDSAPGYVWAYNGFLPFTSFDSMAAWARAEPTPSGSWVFAWDSVMVEPLAPGIATFTAGYTETGADSAGRPTSEQGVITGVVVHRADGWKFVNAHTSTLPPPPPAPAASRR